MIGPCKPHSVTSTVLSPLSETENGGRARAGHLSQVQPSQWPPRLLGQSLAQADQGLLAPFMDTPVLILFNLREKCLFTWVHVCLAFPVLHRTSHAFLSGFDSDHFERLVPAGAGSGVGSAETQAGGNWGSSGAAGASAPTEPGWHLLCGLRADHITLYT